MNNVKEECKLRNHLSEHEVGSTNESKLGKVITVGTRMREKSHRYYVDATSLSKQFDLEGQRVVALDDVTFQVNEGEFMVVLGASGAGKTTLLNIIGGLDRPSTGEIVVDGTNLKDLDEEALSLFRSINIGFIFQNYNLISTLTAIENIEFPMKLAGWEDDELIKMKSRDLLKLVGLLERANHLPFQMSSGEQQRIAIARALANDPPLLLADEPTGNLDWKTGFGIITFLKKLNEEKRKTIIIATHDERITELADVTIHLEKGRITDFAR